MNTLLDATQDPDPKVRTYAYVGLERDRGRAPLDNEQVIRALGAGVSDDDEGASHAAGSALKPYTNRLAADVLLPHLEDPRPHVRSAAIWGIWAHNDEDVVGKLIGLVQRDPDSKVRAETQLGGSA